MLVIKKYPFCVSWRKILEKENMKCDKLDRYLETKYEEIMKTNLKLFLRNELKISRIKIERI